MKAVAMILLGILAVSGCGPESGFKGRYSYFAAGLGDQSTEPEKQIIDETIQEIEDLARRSGNENLNFRSLPIVVMEQDSQDEHQWGHCEFDEQGRGHHIVIFREVFKYSKSLQRQGLSTYLFQILLHEIGHCYLDRAHLYDRIYGDGYFTMRWEDRKGRRHVLSSQRLPASIMHSIPDGKLPEALNKYYVGELLGIFRAYKPGDLKAFLEVRD